MVGLFVSAGTSNNGLQFPVIARAPRSTKQRSSSPGLAPEAAALKAGRLMLAEIDECVRNGESFSFETTLARLAYVGRIKAWRAAGYHVSLFFLRLPDAETAIARVAERVLQGAPHSRGRHPAPVRRGPAQFRAHLQGSGGRVGRVRQRGRLRRIPAVELQQQEANRSDPA